MTNSIQRNKAYCISWLNYSDNDLKSEVVYCKNELEAATLAMIKLTSDPESVISYKDFSTLEEFKDFAFDMGCNINVSEIPRN